MPDWKHRGCFLGACPPGEENTSRIFLLQSLAGGRHQGEPPRGPRPPPRPPERWGGGALANPGAQPEAPDPPRRRSLCFNSRLCRNTQSACHSCFFLCKLKTFTRLPISNSTGSVICFEVCAPGPERVTHNPCFVVVTEGWGEGNCRVERAHRPIVEGNRRLTCHRGLLPGLDQGPGAHLGPLLHALRGTPPGVGRTHGQGRGRKTLPQPRPMLPRRSSGRPASCSHQAPQSCSPGPGAPRGSDGSGRPLELRVLHQPCDGLFYTSTWLGYGAQLFGQTKPA